MQLIPEIVGGGYSKKYLDMATGQQSACSQICRGLLRGTHILLATDNIGFKTKYMRVRGSATLSAKLTVFS